MAEQSVNSIFHTVKNVCHQLCLTLQQVLDTENASLWATRNIIWHRDTGVWTCLPVMIAL